MTLSIATLCFEWHHALCFYDYAECSYVEFHDLFIVMLNVVMLSIIVMYVDMLSSVMFE
jgi:hypothetical protein